MLENGLPLEAAMNHRRWQMLFLVMFPLDVLMIVWLASPTAGLIAAFTTAFATAALLIARKEDLDKAPQLFLGRVITAAQKILVDQRSCRYAALSAFAIFIPLAYVRATTAPVTIKGIVQFSTQEPIDHALVEVLQDNKVVEHTLSDKGTFVFDTLSSLQIVSGRLSVRASWLGASNTQPVSFSLLKLSPIRLVLESPEVPYQVHYFDLQGAALQTFLMQHPLPEPYNRVFGPGYYLVRNDVWNAVTDLASEYASRFPLRERDSPFWTVYDRTRDTEHPDLARLVQDKRIFIATAGEGLGRSIAFNERNALMLPSSRWRWLGSSTRYEGKITELNFVKPIEASDLNQLNLYPSELAAFWRKLTETGVPSNLGTATYFEGPKCNSLSDISLDLPSLALRVMVIENFGKEALYVSSFNARTTVGPLRERGQDETLLKNADVSVIPFDIGLLKRGEKAVLPLQIILRYGEQTSAAETEWKERIAAARREADAPLQAEDVELEPLNHLIVHASDLHKAAVNRAEWVEHEYTVWKTEHIYGPSIEVESARISGVSLRIRPRTSVGNVALWYGIPAGSCPFVYTRSKNLGSWKRQGPVLTGILTQRLRRWDRISLPKNTKQILLKEEEDEVTVLDAIRIEVRLPSGVIQLVEPSQPSLKTIDGRYIYLSKGQTLRIEPADNIENGEIVGLRAYGFYYELAKTVSSTKFGL